MCPPFRRRVKKLSCLLTQAWRLTRIAHDPQTNPPSKETLARSKVMTKCIITIAMFVAAGLTVLPSVCHAQVSPALAQKAPDAAEIVDIAGKKGYVRIIAEFSGANQVRPDPAQLAPIKQHIASMQDAIIASHFGSATNPRAGQGF